MKRYFITVALAAAAMGASAQADTLKINTITQTHSNAPQATIYDGQLGGNKSEYVNVSPFNITGTLNGDAVSLFAYCVDIFQNTSTGNFDVVSLSDYLNDAGRTSLITKLVSANPVAGTTLQDAAMQAAIWEVVNEKKFADIGNVFTTGGKDFRIDFTGNVIETATNNLLANALSTKAGDPSLNFYVAKSNKGQDMLFWTQAQAVPEPATWGLMLAGFGMLGMVMRRRSVQATKVQFA